MAKETLSAEQCKWRAVLVFSLQKALLARNSLTKSLLWRVIYHTMFPPEAVAGCLVTVQNVFDIEAICVIYRRDLMNIGAVEETGLEATFGPLCLVRTIFTRSRYLVMVKSRTLDSQPFNNESLFQKQENLLAYNASLQCPFIILSKERLEVLCYKFHKSTEIKGMRN